MGKKNEPKMKAIIDLWRGYDEKRFFGRYSFFVIAWPVKHPDSHCSYHAYTQNELGICTGCGWVPAFTWHEERQMLVRQEIELQILEQSVEASGYGPLMTVAYRAYVESHKRLLGAPEFNEVAHWWNKLSRKKRNLACQKFQTIITLDITGLVHLMMTNGPV